MFKIIAKAFRFIFPTRDTIILRAYSKKVAVINSLEPKYAAMSDEELKGVTKALKLRLSSSETLNDILCDAFAAVRETAKRVLGMRHYDVQLIGGMALNDGFVSEMKTGEGKTLVATLPAYLNALSGNGVHVVTVNDYLSKRDHDWMSKVYSFLGLNTGAVVPSMSQAEKRQSYAKDITYVTNTEAGFDYLRDNTAVTVEELTITSRPLSYAIIDEIDSILIDEARTPLIISGPETSNEGMYKKIHKIVSKMIDSTCFDFDEKSKNITFNEKGNEVLEKELKNNGLIDQQDSLYSADSYSILNQCMQTLRAIHVLKKDTDYIVKNGQVCLIDEFTGRIAEGKRLSKGLHQAIEAKEKLFIKPENKTIASITYQNFFRIYGKISGMTGTAKTEEKEFYDIYKLKVLAMPTHRKLRRRDDDDLIFINKKQKIEAIVKKVKEKHEIGQPMLIGTANIAASEELSRALKRDGIKHSVLNAKNHEQEASIIAQAGKFKAVTIATNMAGRGTDIILGGNVSDEIKKIKSGDLTEAQQAEAIAAIHKSQEENKAKVEAVNGLCVIGSERHESRRIDDQLRGRSGRLGDVGESIFMMSLEDDLLRIFGGERLQSIFQKVGFQETDALDHPMLTSSVLRSQKKLEGMNYDSRKSVLQYDDIINEQRKVFYEQRNIFLFSEDKVLQSYLSIVAKFANLLVTDCISESGSIDLKKLAGDSVRALPNIEIEALMNVIEYSVNESPDRSPVEAIERIVTTFINNVIKSKVNDLPEQEREGLVRLVIIGSLDSAWQDHMMALNHVREGIHLRAYGQKDPLGEFKRESYELFHEMLDSFENIAVRRLLSFKINVMQQPNSGKVSRNDKCPCGSGKKFKSCHGK